MMDREMFKKIRLGIGAVAGIGAYKMVVDVFSKSQNLGLLKGLGAFGMGLAAASTAMIGVDTFARAAEKTIFKEPEEVQEETDETDNEEEDDE